MGSIPSSEAILLEIQQSFGFKSLQTLQKHRFANLDKKMSEHQAMGIDIFTEVIDALRLGHDPELLDDLVASTMEILQFHSAVANGTRTFNADDRQIVWYLLAYQFVPGLARKYGFWSLAVPVAPGMPGGDLWFVPRLLPSDETRVRLPVQSATEWWLDLLDCPLDTIWKDDKDRASRIRNLQYWRAGNLPTPATIGGSFDAGREFNYQGVFCDHLGSPIEVRFSNALEFVRDRKRLDPIALAREIPSVPASVFEAAISKTASEIEQETFVSAVARRWEKPSNDTVRRRFLLARVVQDCHLRLAKLISPGVDPKIANPVANKVFQLWALFAETYRLTIEADQGCRSEAESNFRFATLVPDWLAQSLLKSIMNVHVGAPEEFSLFLTDRFREVEPGADVCDLFKNGELSTGPAERTVATAYAERKGLARLLGQLWEALEEGWQGEAENLLRQVKEHSRKDEYIADTLFLEGRHRLNGNDVDGAMELFDAAFNKCKSGSYGSTRRIVADACLGTAMGFSYFSERVEKYFRVIATSLRPDEIAEYQLEKLPQKLALGSLFRDISVRSSNNFWEQLYQPYPGVERLSRPAAVQFENLAEGLIKPILAGDVTSIEHWVLSNRKLLDERLLDVRGDTFFGAMLKLVNTFERNFLASTMPRQTRVERVEVDDIVVQLRTSLHVLAEAMGTKALDTPDFKRQTPLMLAADRGDAKLVCILLDRGVDFDAQCIDGRTALHSAASSKSAECYQLILRKGADPTRLTVDGLSALHSAVKFGLVEAVKDTLEKWSARFSNAEITELHEMALDVHANYKMRRTQMAQAGRALGPKPAYKMIADVLGESL